MIKKILIIAGSDACGGAGIQADIKTSTAHKVYSSTALTSLTAQTTAKVFSIHNPPISFLSEQIETLFDDISFDIIKIGMLANSEIIDCVADILKKKAKKIPIIVDPVMVATSGDILLKQNAITSLKEKIIKDCFLLTPNIDEAKILAEIEIKNLADMKKAAIKIKKLKAKNVLIKGGHLDFGDNKIHSILFDEKDQFHFFTNKKIADKSFHGTGCSLSTAIACNIAKEVELVLAVKKANSYIYRSIKNALKIGEGSWVLKHFF
jgi:hydroxymethylpyrimidine kinase/phosphomethylpyrimidine kinase